MTADRTRHGISAITPRDAGRLLGEVAAAHHNRVHERAVARRARGDRGFSTPEELTSDVEDMRLERTLLNIWLSDPENGRP